MTREKLIELRREANIARQAEIQADQLSETLGRRTRESERRYREAKEKFFEELLDEADQQ